MYKYRKLILFLILISSLVITMQIYTAISGNMNPLENAATILTTPIQKWLINITSFIPKQWERFKEKNAAAEENTLLKMEIGRLAQQIELQKDAVTENKHLRDLLNLSKTFPQKQIAAEIMERSLTNWFHIITVNKGTQDSATSNMIALNEEGLVGRVIQTGTKRSRIMLILDPNSAVPAQIRESRALGILYGTGKTTCEMRYISHESRVNIGDTVITSGYGKYFPKGLIIGTITNVTRQEHLFFKTAIVEPRVSFGTLESLMLVEKETEEQ